MNKIHMKDFWKSFMYDNTLQKFVKGFRCFSFIFLSSHFLRGRGVSEFWTGMHQPISISEESMNVRRASEELGRTIF